MCCELCDESRSRLWDLSLKLQVPGAPVTWVTKTNYHVTLKFLGEIDDDRVTTVIRQLQAAKVGSTAFDVQLRGSGAFPHPGAPRVLWAGIEQGATELGSLHEMVDDALAGVGYPQDPRSFHAHVTLGRVRDPSSAGRLLRRALDKSRDYLVGQSKITHLTLMCSDLSQQGARYTALERIPLTG